MYGARYFFLNCSISREVDTSFGRAVCTKKGLKLFISSSFAEEKDWLINHP